MLSHPPTRNFLACVIAAAVSAYVGHYGIALVAAGCALLGVRSLRAPRGTGIAVPRFRRGGSA
jgi:hypothetical protein